jgi:hypothetical protein
MPSETRELEVAAPKAVQPRPVLEPKPAPAQSYSAPPATAAAAPPAAPPPVAAPPPSIAVTTPPAPANAQQEIVSGNLGKNSRDNKSHHANANASDPAAMQKQAEELANADRCDEALRAYQLLEKQHPSFHVPPAGLLPKVRCLRLTGRIDAAQNEIDQLKADRIDLNRLADEQNAILAERQRATKPAAPAAKKASKKASTAADQLMAPAQK